MGTQQFPVTADFVDRNQKMSPRLIFLIASSALILLVIVCGAFAILLKCRRPGRPSSAVGPVFVHAINKRSGMSEFNSCMKLLSSSLLFLLLVLLFCIISFEGSEFIYCCILFLCALHGYFNTDMMKC